MLPTLWVLEAFLFPMNKIHTNFQTYWPDGVKMPPFESQNFEACSLRPPMLWSGLSCRDPFFESFDSGPHEVKVAQKPATHNQYIFTRNTVFKVPRFGKKNTDIVTLPKLILFLNFSQYTSDKSHEDNWAKTERMVSCLQL